MCAENYDLIYNALLNETELLSQQGVTPVEMVAVMSDFLVSLAFDTAPTSDHAGMVIMSAVTERMTSNAVAWHDDSSDE